MNKRLIWNFEIDSTHSLQLPESNDTFSPEDPRWESRYFWPADERITLYGLSESFLELIFVKHPPTTIFLVGN